MRRETWRTSDSRSRQETLERPLHLLESPRHTLPTCLNTAAIDPRSLWFASAQAPPPGNLHASTRSRMRGKHLSRPRRRPDGSGDGAADATSGACGARDVVASECGGRPSVSSGPEISVQVLHWVLHHWPSFCLSECVSRATSSSGHLTSGCCLTAARTRQTKKISISTAPVNPWPSTRANQQLYVAHSLVIDTRTADNTACILMHKLTPYLS